MVFVGTIHSHPSQSSKCDNYYYNKLSKIIKYTIVYPLYSTSLKLLTSGSPPIEV